MNFVNRPQCPDTLNSNIPTLKTLFSIRVIMKALSKFSGKKRRNLAHFKHFLKKPIVY